jgi:hypothetical protein
MTPGAIIYMGEELVTVLVISDVYYHGYHQMDRHKAV